MIKTAAELIAKAQTRISCLDVSSAKTLYEGSKSIIIDVREPEDAANSKLKNSINIPRGLIEINITENLAQKDDPIIDYDYGEIRREGVFMNVYYSNAIGKAQ